MTTLAHLTIARRGFMLVLSSPSGAGKTTIARRLLELEPVLSLSISVTTRPARPGEQEGVDYFFTDQARFEAMAANGELLEWAEVFGNSYGTPRAPVEQALADGRDVLFDVDWQGARQLRAEAGDDVVSVFVLPPSAAILEQRLVLRAGDPPDVVAGRMARAGDEISHWDEYDYAIINADVEESVRAVRAILSAERLRRTRRTGLAPFVRGLLDDL